MLNYNSLLKGRIFKNKKIKSSFLIEDKKENCQSYKNTLSNIVNKDDCNIIRKLNSIKTKHKKSADLHILEKHISNKKIDNIFISEDYEDLFLYFLFETEKIDFFEKQIEYKKEKSINFKYAFNYMYQLFNGEKIRWNNFLFYEPVYKILYVRSRKMQKEIIQYSLFSNNKIEDILNSFNKKYTCKKKVKNWCLNPQEAFKNYEKILQKEKIENEKVTSGSNPYFKNVNFTDFVVKTDNNGKGKTLIFLGKAINIYIDDINKYYNEDKGISMAVEESEFNKKIKNEIVYTFDDIYLKTKKRNMTINNKIECNRLKNKYKSLSKKKVTNLKSNKNLDFNNLSKHISFDKKEEKNKAKKLNKTFKLNNNLVNNYNNCTNKFPSITKLGKKDIRDRKLLKESRFEGNDLHLNDNKIKKTKYNNLFPLKEKNKNQKNYINSFSIFERDKIPKSRKIIFNFFSKENSDFYY